MNSPRSQARIGELLIPLGLLGLGLYILVQTQSIADVQGYAHIGPRLFPNLVGAGLIVLGSTLGWRGARAGWRNVPLEQEDHASANWKAAVIISAALVLHMALIGRAGFILAGILLFTLIARAFRSSRLLLDLAVATALVSAVFYVFTRILGLSLPQGLLRGY